MNHTLCGSLRLCGLVLGRAWWWSAEGTSNIATDSSLQPKHAKGLDDTDSRKTKKARSDGGDNKTNGRKKLSEQLGVLQYVPRVYVFHQVPIHCVHPQLISLIGLRRQNYTSVEARCVWKKKQLF